MLRVEGKFIEAEAAYMREKELREKVLGKEHPQVAITLLNIGGMHVPHIN